MPATLIAATGMLPLSLRQSMAYLGLVPSEHSKGQRQRGGLTSGNKAARRLLIEAAWCYRFRWAAARCGSGRRSSPADRESLESAAPAVRAIAGSPAWEPAKRPPPSPASWPASSGPLPGARRRRRADRNKRVIASKGGASEPRDMLPPGKAGNCQKENPRSTTAGSPIRRWSLDRGSSATYQRSCGSDPRIRV